MKKVFKILTLIMLILTILKITDTYAKYLTKATASTEQEIGKWVIKLNEMDIYSETGETIKFDIAADNVTSDSNTMPGKISPSSTWGANLTIDPTGTDVAVRYDIEVDVSIIKDMDIKYELSTLNGVKKITKTGENTYTGIITLDEIKANKKEELRCSVEWKNNEEKNDNDTELGEIPNQKLQLLMKVTCVQYLGETITEYTEN